MSEPDLHSYFMTGKVDRIFHQQYCWLKAWKRWHKEFPKKTD